MLKNALFIAGLPAITSVHAHPPKPAIAPFKRVAPVPIQFQGEWNVVLHECGCAQQQSAGHWRDLDLLLRERRTGSSGRHGDGAGCRLGLSA